MALVTVQRELSTKPRPNISVSNISVTADYESDTKGLDEIDTRKPTIGHNKKQSVSECYFVVKGAALILPHDECMHVYRKSPSINGGTNDIQRHLKSMFYLLREDDTLRMAVKLESMHPGRARYLVVVSCIGPQNNEESCLLGIDCGNITTIGLVLPVFADTMITLDGDGGFSVSSSSRHHIFKPVSVQAMWSALQTLHRCSAKAREYNYFTTGGSHQWVESYEKCIDSDRSCLNEWHAMDDLVSKRPPSPDSVRSKPTEREATENLIRVKLKEVMMSVDLDEVTSKCIRTSLEEQLDMNLDEYKSFIDQEMLMILGQMDAPTEIFEYLYLGSEWNASNLEELKAKGIDHILNVTREIDNFFPGMFDYLNVRVYDDESTEMLKHWDKTFKYIRKVKSEGSKVLVHCKMGISRSASVVIAYVMKAYDWNFEQALDFVRNKRSCIKPNQGFVKQLEIYQGILDASKQRHNSLWRSKSETNLKIIGTPRHLKKKELNENIFSTSGEENKCIESNQSIIDHLSVPGYVSRPKSWSPDDSAIESLFPSTPLTLSKPCKLARSQPSKDPSYYLNLEAGRCFNPIQIVKDDRELIQTSAESTQNPATVSRVSSIKNRINELESQAGSQPMQDGTQRTGPLKTDLTTVKSGNMVVNSKSGVVLNLATQFETCSKPSTPSPEMLESFETEQPSKPVKFSIGEIIADAVDPVVSQTKPPVAKHQAIIVKPNTYPKDSSVSSTSNNAQASSKAENWLCGPTCLTQDSKSLSQSASSENAQSEELYLINSSSSKTEIAVNAKLPLSSGFSIIENVNPSLTKTPSQTNVREGFSRQSSSSSCISTPKSVELPFSWSRQSSCSSPSTASSPPIAQRWPKTAVVPLALANVTNTSLAKLEKEPSDFLKIVPGLKTSPENEPYTDVKAIQQRLMHMEKTHTAASSSSTTGGKDIVYDREVIPYTPGTVRRTKQKLESNTLKRTASFDSSFPSQSWSTPSTPPEISHLDQLELGLSNVSRSKSLRNDARPRSMAGVFPSNWRATPTATNCAPIPQVSYRQTSDPSKSSFARSRMLHSRSTPSVVEAVNQVLCGTREILSSAIQSIPSQISHTDVSNSIRLNLSKNSLELENPKLLSNSYKSSLSTALSSEKTHCDTSAPRDFVQAINSTFKGYSFSTKDIDSTLANIKLPESEVAFRIYNQDHPSSEHPILAPFQMDNVIKHRLSNLARTEKQPAEIEDSRKGMGLGVNKDSEIGQSDQFSLKDLDGSEVDCENILVSITAESNSEGVVKRLTKELEAKSGSPAGGRKEKIIIVDKDSKKDNSDSVKITSLPSPKSPNLPLDHGAKNSPFSSSGTTFLRKARTRSDGSDRNSLVLDSSQNSVQNMSRRKSSLDMNLMKESTNKTDITWINGQSPLAGDVKEATVLSKNVLQPQSMAVTSRTTSTGRPPPGASKPFANPASMPPLSPTSSDACQQKKSRKQQQGKTHPLSKLTPKQRHPNPLYNTM